MNIENRKLIKTLLKTYKDGNATDETIIDTIVRVIKNDKDV